jgi:hypothetical protein
MLYLWSSDDGACEFARLGARVCAREGERECSELVCGISATASVAAIMVNQPGAMTALFFSYQLNYSRWIYDCLICVRSMAFSFELKRLAGS